MSKKKEKSDVVLNETIEVFVTDDYSMFNIHTGLNRFVSPNKVSMLIKEIQKVDLLPNNPILVNEKYDIIDGQTRFLAAKELNKPIYFTIKSGITLDIAPSLNMVQKPWKHEDYILHFETKGNEHYKYLHEAYKRTGINISTLSNLLMNGVVKQSGLNADIMRCGLFEVRYAELTETLYERAKDFDGINRFKYWRCRNFLSALLTITTTKSYSHSQMIQKLLSVGYLLENKGNSEDFLKLLLDIYNWRNTKNKIELIKDIQ